MKTEYYTYAHIRNDTNKIFYIGKGKGKRAWKYGRNKIWKNIVEKHGYTVDILAYWSTEAEAFEHEEILIKCFRKMGYELVNRTDGGEGLAGHIHTAETRTKMSIRARSRAPSSAETRAKISIAAKNRIVSLETRIKLAEAGKGRVHTDEDRAKMSVAAKARTPMSAETKAKMSVAAKARSASTEFREMISKRNKGRIRSEETKAKMSAARKAKYELLKQQKEQKE